MLFVSAAVPVDHFGLRSKASICSRRAVVNMAGDFPSQNPPLHPNAMPALPGSATPAGRGRGFLSASATAPLRQAGRRGPVRGRGGRSPSPPAGWRAARVQSLSPGTPGPPVCHWSITIAVRGGDVPSGWLDRFEDYGKTHCEKLAASFELGGYSGACTFRPQPKSAATGTQHMQMFRPSISESSSLSCVARVALSVVCPLVTLGPKRALLGYMQKHLGQGHYRLVVHEVSDAKLSEVQPYSRSPPVCACTCQYGRVVADGPITFAKSCRRHQAAPRLRRGPRSFGQDVPVQSPVPRVVSSVSLQKFSWSHMRFDQ